MKISSQIIAVIIFVIVSVSCSHSNSGEIKTLNTSAQTPAKDLSVEDATGKALYTKYCLACHQTDGSGVPGMYPPLMHSSVINSGGKDKIINILLTGLKGPIEVNGQKFNQQMPAQSFLTNEQIADIINYVSKSFNNNGPSIKPSEVDSLRKSIP